MTYRRLVVPEALRASAQALNMSPAIAAGGLVFLTGATGSDPSGEMPTEALDQFNAVFDKIGMVLGAADLSLDAIVEMTTYHVGLRDHFDTFDAVRLARLAPPYPAWTAVEVVGLRRPGAVVEMRVIAQMPA